MPTDLELEETLDGALGGAVRVLQLRRGYRYSLDALLLADFASPAQGRVIDLGTGSGVVALVMAHRSPTITVVGVELQEAMAARAERSVALNAMQERVTIVCGDLREPTLASASFDLVVSNPPYQAVEGGRVNPDAERAIARHEVHATIDDVARAAKRLLKPEGRLAVVYPHRRLEALRAALQLHGFHPTRARSVLPRVGEPPKLVLIEAGLSAGVEERVLPSLVLHGTERDYTDEAARILGEPKR